MKISKRTILLLGALVVLAIGSNLDAAGLKPDRGRGGGTRGKGGKGGVTKKDFKKSAQAAVKALTAKIKADFDQTIGGRKILKAVANGNDATFTRPLPNTINFANAKQSTNFGRIQTEATAIDAEITKYKKDLTDSNTSDNELMAIEKAAKNGGTLYKQYEQFFNDLQTASLPPRNVAKTAAKLKKDYTNLLEAAVPATYSFANSTNLGGNLLSVPANDQSWFVANDASTIKLSGTVGTALTSVQDAQTAYKDALDLINAISKVDAAGIMQKADNSVITDKDITNEIASAKAAVAAAQTAVNGAFENKGGVKNARVVGNAFPLVEGGNALVLDKTSLTELAANPGITVDGSVITTQALCDGLLNPLMTSLNGGKLPASDAETGVVVNKLAVPEQGALKKIAAAIESVNNYQISEWINAL